jgi:DNA helicase-2/ATP-dependent DNA helicase PcrA
MDLLAGLNEQQRQAVTAPQGPVLVLAGPGSGKTRVLTFRAAYLVSQLGARPSQILAVTFTNKAAREMRGRILDLLGGRTEGASRGMKLGTFHSVCASILRREADRLPFSRQYVIYDADDQVSVVRQILKEMNLDPRQMSPNRIHNAISRAKNELIDVKEFASDSYFAEIAGRVYARYQKVLTANDALDFDDLLFWVVRLLKENLEVRAAYRRRYPHLLVDEFQDTNTAQYTLLRLLAGEDPDLFLVGDPDQSIYRWRGADYRNVRRFQEDYPQAKVFLLEQNYRSTQNILDVAMAVIDRNAGRQRKQLFTERGQGLKVIAHEAYDEADEASFVIDTIARLTYDKQVEPGDCAIMYRTNAQSRALEEAFLHAGLAYRLVGAQRFYGRREVKDVIAYLRLVHNPADQVSLLRVINTPTRGIGAKTIESLLSAADETGLSPANILLDLAQPDQSQFASRFSGRALAALSDFGALLAGWVAMRDEPSLVTLIDKILKDVDYRGYIDDGSEEGEERWSNVVELREAAFEFNEIGLTTFLEHIALVSDQDTLTEELNAPTMLTLHAAKGLEFPVVFIVGLDEGLLPHQRSFDDPEAMAEERRLFYVGITRAQNRLYLVRAFRRRQAGTSLMSDPSSFLEDIPPDLVQGNLTISSTWDQLSYQRQTTWEPPTRTPQKSRYQPGMQVRHPRFGEGVVLQTLIERGDEEVTVEFADGETKHLLASMAHLEIIS